MSSTPHFAMCDTKKPDGCYIQFERVILDDDTAGKPDEMSEGYWPCADDEENPGYVEPHAFDKAQREAQERMDAWERGDWNYIGVRARALCLIVRNHTGVHINLESPGVWGIESDAGEYLNEVYREEIEQLKSMIAGFANPTYEESP